MSRVSEERAEEDWRRKYFDSLKVLEDESRRSRADQQALFGLVTHLCAAARGQSPTLDEVLRRLREAVRKEARAGELELLSRDVADALRETDDSWRMGVTPAPVATLPNASGPTPGTSQGSAAGEQRVRAVLSRLLGELRQDQTLADSAAAIDVQLAVALDSEQLPEVVERVGALLVQRLRNLEGARAELEQLLSAMVEQLDALNNYIAELNAAETQRTSSADTLDLQITGEVHAIGESVAAGTDLAKIRRHLQDRLASISRHLQGFHAREEERLRLARERTALMRARMEEMEGEARALQERLSEKKRQTLLDPLTRVLNRLGWDERIADELERWQRFRQPACVIAWDIDHFKLINDTYGHRAGDRVLVAVAETLSSSIRGTDCVARYGGEEFVMLLPATVLAEGLRIAEQLRAAVTGIGFHFRGKPVSVTMSGGVTQLAPGDNANSAFDRADKAMYRAKESGRNRVASA